MAVSVPFQIYLLFLVNCLVGFRTTFKRKKQEYRLKMFNSHNQTFARKSADLTHILFDTFLCAMH